MKVLRYKFKKSINLYCFTDVHIGAAGHDAEKFNKVWKKFLKDKDGYCFFNGDSFECIPPSYKDISLDGQIMGIDEQKERFIELVRQAKGKVLFIRTGNHEERIWKLVNCDLYRDIGRETGIPIVSLCMTDLHIFIGNRKIRVVSTHGVGGGSKKILTNLQLTFPGADVYFTGHTHEKYYNSTNMWVDTSSGEEVLTNQMEIVGGSFLGWAKYARENNMRPTQTGCYILRLDESGAEIKEDVR